MSAGGRGGRGPPPPGCRPAARRPRLTPTAARPCAARPPPRAPRPPPRRPPPARPRASLSCPTLGAPSGRREDAGGPAEPLLACAHGVRPAAQIVLAAFPATCRPVQTARLRLPCASEPAARAGAAPGAAGPARARQQVQAAQRRQQQLQRAQQQRQLALQLRVRLAQQRAALQLSQVRRVRVCRPGRPASEARPRPLLRDRRRWQGCQRLSRRQHGRS